MTIKVTWVDSGREPQCPPNPAFPEGQDIWCPGAAEDRSCKTPLPYPAKRCGYYIVECDICGQKVIVTTAGRPDDPRSIAMTCLKKQRPRTP